MYWTNKFVNYIKLRKTLEGLLIRAFDEATSELIDKINREFGDEVSVTKEVNDQSCSLSIYDVSIFINVDDLIERGLNIDVKYETVLQAVKDIIIEQGI